MWAYRLLQLFIAALLAPTIASAAGSANLSVSATIPSKNICNFRTPNVNLNFGTLDPLTPVDVIASATAAFRCMGSAPMVVYLVSENYGLYKTGPGGNRMRHATNPAAYLPYTISMTPQTGSFPREVAPVDHTITITGLVRGTDYVTAANGNYADTVTLTINP